MSDWSPTLVNDMHGTRQRLLATDAGVVIEGIATQGMRRPGGGYFRCPLISHVEGNLWQGGFEIGVDLPDDFKYVVSLYKWYEYPLPEGCQRFTYTMYDDNGAPDAIAVDQIAEVVVDCVAKGKTLVHCQAGLNRSGLVAARALTLMGDTPDAAIAKLRASRCDMVLCNQAFETWLRSLA